MARPPPARGAEAEGSRRWLSPAWPWGLHGGGSSWHRGTAQKPHVTFKHCTVAVGMHGETVSSQKILKESMAKELHEGLWSCWDVGAHIILTTSPAFAHHWMEPCAARTQVSPKRDPFQKMRTHKAAGKWVTARDRVPFHRWKCQTNGRAMTTICCKTCGTLVACHQGSNAFSIFNFSTYAFSQLCSRTVRLTQVSALSPKCLILEELSK